MSARRRLFLGVHQLTFFSSASSATRNIFARTFSEYTSKSSGDILRDFSVIRPGEMAPPDEQSDSVVSLCGQLSYLESDEELICLQQRVF